MNKKIISPGNVAEPPERSPAPSPVMEGRVSRNQMLALATLLLAPWCLAGLIFAGLYWSKRPVVSGSANISSAPSPGSSPTKKGRHFSGNPGPWGRLEFTRIAIEPPNEFIAVDQAEHGFGPPRWVFKGRTKEQVLAFCRNAGMTAAQQAMLPAAAWEQLPDGWAVKPDENLVLRLSAQTRANVYLGLNLFPENKPQNNPYVFHPEYLDDRLAGSGLSEQTIARFKSLLYPSGPRLLFADLDRLLPRLPNEDEKARFMKMVARRATLLMHLRIEQGANVDELVRYWSMGGRAKDLRPLLESIARVPGGGDIDVIHLLPHFARRRLYTYPFPGNALTQVSPDCHWTTFNFFSDQPEDQYATTAGVNRVLGNDYFSIAKPSQLGDVVLLISHSAQAIHSATYIADDVVFSKNGVGNKQPWILMTLTNMVDTYSAHYPPDKPVQVAFMRSKKF
jgi:hypothetical protein